MITNDRQYAISCKKRDGLRAALDDLDPREAETRLGSIVFADAERNALNSQIQTLDCEINEYKLLKSGAKTILKAESLEELPLLLIQARIARGMSQRELAEVLGLKEQQIQRHEADLYFSASFRRLTEVASKLELNISKIAELRGDNSGIAKSEVTEEWDYSRFPVKEMYKRNWFEGFHGTLADAKNSADELLKSFMGSAVGMSPALHRKRVRFGGDLDTYALLAWEAKVRRVAEDFEDVKPFKPKHMDDEWFRELAQLSTYDDGPIRALNYVYNAGIVTVIEPHLPGTYLDGAAMLGKRFPIIALTLRYDRIDNFWFVLFHELFHVKLHLRKGKLDVIFDDLETEGGEMEEEEDRCAGNALIPDEAWESALPRFLRTKESVEVFSTSLQIHEAIVVGRIRKESDNYTLLNDMVGRGEVRCQFKGINFA